MTAHAHPAPTPNGDDDTALEDTLEVVPIVARACVARADHRGTVVVVGLDAARAAAWARARALPDPDDLAALAAHPALTELLDRALAEGGYDPTAVRVRVLPRGWLPDRDVFPAPIRRRCVRARYAPLLVTVLAPIATPLLAA